MQAITLAGGRLQCGWTVPPIRAEVAVCASITSSGILPTSPRGAAVSRRRWIPNRSMAARIPAKERPMPCCRSDPQPISKFSAATCTRGARASTPKWQRSRATASIIGRWAAWTSRPWRAGPRRRASLAAMASASTGCAGACGATASGRWFRSSSTGATASTPPSRLRPAVALRSLKCKVPRRTSCARCSTYWGSTLPLRQRRHPAWWRNWKAGEGG